jgi:acyl-lipid omega-6 desaturase (Delta-12 desaturase)
MNSPFEKGETSETSWIKIVSKYNHPNPVKSWLQFSINLFVFSILWFLMFESLSLSYWITLGLSLPAAGMLVRLFIIYHDCTHGSFFKSRRLRNFIGLLIGVLTFTPYFSWSHNHIIHHETAGNLDKRGIGDVWTLTVDEYRASTLWNKIVYRFYRNPITMFLVGPLYVFLIGNRFTKKGMDKTARMGVYITNAGLLVFAVGMSLLIGVKAYLMIQLPVIYISGILGFWLFYVQHQFDPSYWTRSDTWDYKRVAMEGSSFYKLPRILQFFTGNIGYHHIHHLSPLIPNYNLAKCHRENPMFHKIKPLTFWQSFRAMSFRVWNEETREMISFRKMKLV